MGERMGMNLISFDGTRLLLEKLQFLGSGAYGVVYSAKFLNKGEFRIPRRHGKLWRNCAVKFYRSTPLRKTEVENFQRISQLVHMNVIKILSFGSIEEGVPGLQINPHNLYIALELCDGGTLNRKVTNEKLPYKAVLDYTKQILLGIQHLHKHKIIHTDLKGENVFLSLNCSVVKIGDLDAHVALQGIHTVTNDVKHRQGTWKWMSPEMVLHKSEIDPQYFYAGSELEVHKVGRSTDIWSLGCIFLEMITQAKFRLLDCGGKEISSYEGLLLAAPKGFSPEVPDLKAIGFDNMLDFLGLCFQTAPSGRPQATDLLRNHVFHPKKVTKATKQGTELSRAISSTGTNNNQCGDVMVEKTQKSETKTLKSETILAGHCEGSKAKIKSIKPRRKQAPLT